MIQKKVFIQVDKDTHFVMGKERVETKKLCKLLAKRGRALIDERIDIPKVIKSVEKIYKGISVNMFEVYQYISRNQHTIKYSKNSGVLDFGDFKVLNNTVLLYSEKQPDVIVSLPVTGLDIVDEFEKACIHEKLRTNRGHKAKLEYRLKQIKNHKFDNELRREFR